MNGGQGSRYAQRWACASCALACPTLQIMVGGAQPTTRNDTDGVPYREARTVIMLRRDFLLVGAGLLMAGCKSTQYARVIKPGEREMVGSHQAGQETFRPLVDEAVTKL